MPGHKGNFVYVKDAVRKQAYDQPPLPVPTSTEVGGGVSVAPKMEGTDPFDYKE